MALRNILRGLLATAAFVGATGCMHTGASARSRITELREIDVRPGSNQINLFVPDGRSALVTDGWRDLGGGRGYRIYSVMVPNTDPLRVWDIVPVEPAADEPNGREATEIAGSVRFGRGWLDGVPTTLLFTARRDPSASGDANTPAHMVIDTYRLVTARSGGGAQNAFEPVMSTRSAAEFCSGDLAIAREFGLGLPATYTGANRRDGCPGRV